MIDRTSGVRMARVMTCCLLAAACSSPTARHAAATTAPLGAVCATPSQFGADGTADEVHGTSATGEIWKTVMQSLRVSTNAGSTFHSITEGIIGYSPVFIAPYALDTNGAKVDDPMAVFAFVFDSLPDRVKVYPTENYYYFTFLHNGMSYEAISGSMPATATTAR